MASMLWKEKDLLLQVGMIPVIIFHLSWSNFCYIKLNFKSHHSSPRVSAFYFDVHIISFVFVCLSSILVHKFALPSYHFLLLLRPTVSIQYVDHQAKTVRLGGGGEEDREIYSFWGTVLCFVSRKRVKANYDGRFYMSVDSFRKSRVLFEKEAQIELLWN